MYYKHPHYALLSAAAGGTIILDSSVPAGRHVKVLSLHAYLEAGTGTSFKIEQQGAVVQLSPVYVASVTLPYNPVGWFKSPSGTGLKSVIVVGTGGVWSALLNYVVVDD